MKERNLSSVGEFAAKQVCDYVDEISVKLVSLPITGDSSSGELKRLFLSSVIEMAKERLAKIDDVNKVSNSKKLEQITIEEVNKISHSLMGMHLKENARFLINAKGESFHPVLMKHGVRSVFPNKESIEKCGFSFMFGQQLYKSYVNYLSDRVAFDREMADGVSGNPHYNGIKVVSCDWIPNDMMILSPPSNFQFNSRSGELSFNDDSLACVIHDVTIYEPVSEG